MKTYKFNAALVSHPINWPTVDSTGNKVEVIDAYFNEAETNFKNKVLAKTSGGKYKIFGLDELFLSADKRDLAVRCAMVTAFGKGHSLKIGNPNDTLQNSELSLQNFALYGNEKSGFCLSIHSPEEQNWIAEGHNPKKVTVGQLGADYRLLSLDEIVNDNTFPVLSEIEMFSRGLQKWWTSSYRGDGKEQTYRTKLTRDELAEKRVPKWKHPVAPNGYEWLNEVPTKSLYNEGWRGLLKGEKFHNGDAVSNEYYRLNILHDSHGLIGTIPNKDSCWDFLTKRPLPAPKWLEAPTGDGAYWVWHNVNGWVLGQVTGGHLHLVGFISKFETSMYGKYIKIQPPAI
jgi:hypothetical protein